MNLLINGIKERLNNSFSSPLSLFFILWNWQIIVYLITGNENASVRITNILQYLNNKGYASTLCIPLIYTILYLFIMPLIASTIEYWNHIVELRKINKIEANHLSNNNTIEYKFSLAKELAERVYLAANTIERTNGDIPSAHKRIKLCCSAIMETNNKQIQDHYRELKLQKEI